MSAELNLNGMNVDAEANGNRTAVYTRQTPHEVKQMRKKGLPWILAALALLLVVLVVLLLFVAANGFGQNTKPISSAQSVEDLVAANWPSQSPRSLLANFKRIAVVSDNGLCSEIGRAILFRGGNAADAAIATAACIGGLHTHSSGLGGGFLATYYAKSRGKCMTVDARETAPAKTNFNTFVDNPKDVFVGYKAIGVPGEVYGYWSLFKLYGSGRVAWQDLIYPTIRLLNEGYPATKLMQVNLELREKEIMEEPTMRSFFVNSRTGQLFKEGEIIRNPILAETYRKIAVSPDPVRLFYNGEIAQTIEYEVSTQNDGYLTKGDLETYRTVVDQQPLENSHFDDELVMCGPKPSSSFAVTQLIHSVISHFYPPGTNSSIVFNDPQFYHRFIEAQKFAYAHRHELADPKFVKEAESMAVNMTTKEFTEAIVNRIADRTLDSKVYGATTGQVDDQGTSSISIIDADGNSIALTSSVNNVFGALRRSERLGIIWNDVMDDFSLPGVKNYFGFEPSPKNYIEPGKRPMSSMSPMIIYNKITKEVQKPIKDVKATLGAAGGSKICSALAQVLLHTLNCNRTLKEAVDFPRIHNQFTPAETTYEAGFPELLLGELKERGHNVTKMQPPFATVQAIVRNTDGSLSATTDFRRPVLMYPTGA
ncbi:hypothetical protein M3Y98_00141500 [Aphelenchoides besseyi]|nr:hypothetical protein M3Y98_00141500 [Aphelenchoides besseyi]KAI6199706.1 hypothetical protein M3Y96_00655300 [Aphelenchoides besseyi]